MRSRLLVPRTSRQEEAIARLEAEYPEPMRVGWRCTPDGPVRVSLYESWQHDERGHSFAEGTIGMDGDVIWFRSPPPAGSTEE